MLAGIPQQGIYLGKPNAPVRLVEFADLQCPFCREYTLQTLPQLVQDYVRTGKVRMEFRNLSFIGDDSVTAGRSASASGEQSKLWNFVDVFYHNQGEENSGYVTQQFLDKIYNAAGVNAAQATAFAQTPAALRPLATANAMADTEGVSSTPTILIAKRGGSLQKLNAGPTDVNAFKSAIDSALGQA